MRHLVTIAAGIMTAVFVSVAPAYPQSASPDTLAAAKELVQTMGGADQIKTILPVVMQQLKSIMAQGQPAIERDFDQLTPPLLEAFNREADTFTDAVAEIYAQNFASDEIRQVTAFYKTPTGRKFLEKMPVLVQQSMTMGQKFAQKLMQDIQSRMTDELRKRGHKI